MQKDRKKKENNSQAEGDLFFETIYMEVRDSMQIDINILASTDIHGYYTSWDYSFNQRKIGNMAQISTLVKQEREKCKNTIVVDVGDLIQGNCAELFAKEEVHPGVIAMNHIGYDLWEMGNHEYNYGYRNLERYIGHFRGVALGGNVYKEGKRLHAPYAIIEKEGIKIAFIGLVTSLINDFEKTGTGPPEFFVSDMKEEWKKIQVEMQEKVDYVVGLFHCGLENEDTIKNTGIKDILSGEKNINAVFCGHVHELINTKIGTIPVLEAGKFAQAMGKLYLRFEKKGDRVKLLEEKAQLIRVEERIQEDRGLMEKLSFFHQRAIDHSNEVVGVLEGESMILTEEIRGIPQIRVEESDIVDFFLDVVRYYGKADVSMIQIDNNQAGLQAGKIRRKDIYKNYTYVSGGITSYKMTGRSLKKILAYAADYYNSSQEGDINISFNFERGRSKYSSNYFFGNLKYTIDLTKKEKISDVFYSNGKKVKDEDSLIFATNQYRMNKFISIGLIEEKVEKIYSSKEELHHGGSIRNLAIQYTKEVLDGVLRPKKRKDWEIITGEIDADIREKAIFLINAGYVDLYHKKGIQNVKSINIYEPIDEIEEGLKKIGIPVESFQNKGELYDFAYKYLQQNKEGSK